MGLPFDAPGIRIYRLCIAATCDLFEKRERPLPADDKAEKLLKSSQQLCTTFTISISSFVNPQNSEGPCSWIVVLLFARQFILGDQCDMVSR